MTDELPRVRIDDCTDGVLEMDTVAPAQGPYRERTHTVLVALVST